jgi:hypothetical protein
MGAILMPTVDPYCVSGAGTSAYNGTYSYSAGVWSKVGDASRVFFYNFDVEFWVMTNGVQDVYYNSGSSSAPPSTGWTVVSPAGLAPAPTLTAGECGSGTTTTTTTTPAPSYINFPTSPSTGQTYSFNGTIWIWNGVGWKKRLILPSQDIFMSGNYGGL